MLIFEVQPHIRNVLHSSITTANMIFLQAISEGGIHVVILEDDVKNKQLSNVI